MVGIIDMDYLGGVRCLQLGHAFHGNVAVLFPKMQHYRTFGLFTRSVRNAATVVRCRSGQSRYASRAHPGKKAAPAVPNDADLAGGRDCLHGSVDILHRIFSLARGLVPEPFLDFSHRIANLDAWSNAVKQCGRDRHIAIGGIAISYLADVIIDTEDLLYHHDGAARLSCWLGTICAQAMAIGGRQLDNLSHQDLRKR